MGGARRAGRPPRAPGGERAPRAGPVGGDDGQARRRRDRSRSSSTSSRCRRRKRARSCRGAASCARSRPSSTRAWGRPSSASLPPSPPRSSRPSGTARQALALTSRRFRPTTDGSPVEYVIVTSEAMAGEFQRLADWKTQKGVQAVVRTVEWIDQTYPNGVDRAERIRFFIRDAYQNWSTLYVLLGGDTDVVQLRYAQTFAFHESIPADLYFTCLDGNWNGDGDERFGETAGGGNDQADLHFEVTVGRAPVSTVAAGAGVRRQGPPLREEPAHRSPLPRLVRGARRAALSRSARGDHRPGGDCVPPPVVHGRAPLRGVGELPGLGRADRRYGARFDQRRLRHRAPCGARLPEQHVARGRHLQQRRRGRRSPMRRGIRSASPSTAARPRSTSTRSASAS